MSEPTKLMERSIYFLQRARDCLALVHHEGYRNPSQAEEFFFIKEFLRDLDNHRLERLKAIAKKYPEHFWED